MVQNYRESLVSTLPPRGLALPEKESLRGNPHLYECFKKIEEWMRRTSGFLAEAGTGGTTTVAAGGATTAFEPTQDSVDPRKYTIPGSDSWVADSIRIYLNGQRLRTSLLTVSGTGNRTIELDASVMAPGVDDLVEGEGVKE